MAIEALGSTVGDRIKGQSIFNGWSWASMGIWLREQLSAQEVHAFLYVPFFLMFGDWIYFALYFEPSTWLTVLTGMAAAACLLQRRRNTLIFLCGMLLLGIVTSKLRETEVATPVLRGPTSGVTLGGYIANFSDRSNNARMLDVAVEEATGIPEGEQPLRVRIYAPQSEWLEVGDYIKFKAYLAPLPRPVIPGGFDYARNLYFSSIGAGGRMIGEPEYVAKDVPLRFEYRRFFRSLRQSINERMFAAIPGPLGHFGASMVTGDRFGIGDDITASVQISGLAHMVGVAGLHMSIVGGFVFWIVRAVLSLVPTLALRYPIKKWAAIAALLVCFFYMLLADSGSRTERSFVMSAIMFIAILLDRPALSMRNLALSAVIVLLVTPEECLGASFQMSYLAVMAIIAFHGWYRTVRAKHLHAGGWKARLWDHMKQAVITGAGTSVAAGSATGIAAANQFGRLEPYTVFANGFALPVAELTVLPPAVIAVAAMPVGLEYYPLKVMQFGLWFTMLISDWIVSWPGANLMVAKPNVFGIIALVIGAGLVCVGYGRFRLLGWPTMVLGLVLCSLTQKPSFMIEDRAANVAIANPQGQFVLASAANKFASSKWLQDNGETISVTEAAERSGWDCTTGDCFSDLAPMSVSYLREKSGQGVYCPPTDIIIADFPLHHQCREAKLVIDRIDVWRKGAHAITFNNGRFVVTTARDEQGERPWAYDSRKGIGGKARGAEVPQAATTAQMQ